MAPYQRAEYAGNQYRDRRDRQGEAASHEKPRQHVSTEMVSSERMSQARKFQPGGQILIIGVVRRENGREEGDESYYCQNSEQKDHRYGQTEGIEFPPN